jgi:tetraacyldisaccharide 4'-kinase
MPLGCDAVRGKRVLAFSGIGSHNGFAASLREAGANLVAERRFRDHHIYTGRDLDGILEAAGAADACVTTEKDMVRLIADPGLAARVRGPVPFLYATAAIRFTGGERVLEGAVAGVISRRGGG